MPEIKNNQNWQSDKKAINWTLFLPVIIIVAILLLGLFLAQRSWNRDDEDHDVTDENQDGDDGDQDEEDEEETPVPADFTEKDFEELGLTVSFPQEFNYKNTENQIFIAEGEIILNSEFFARGPHYVIEKKEKESDISLEAWARENYLDKWNETDIRINEITTKQIGGKNVVSIDYTVLPGDHPSQSSEYDNVYNFLMASENTVIVVKWFNLYSATNKISELNIMDQIISNIKF